MEKDGIYLNKKAAETLKDILKEITDKDGLQLNAEDTKALKEILDGMGPEAKKKYAGLSGAIKEHYENKSGSETE